MSVVDCETELIRASVLRARVERFLVAVVTGRFRALDIQIHYNGILPASHNYGLTRNIWAGIDFLMWDVGRHVNEIAGIGLSAEL